MIFGLAGVIGSACVFNNYADRNIDARMERTKKRPLVAGTIKPRNALLFASVLVVVGVVLLWMTDMLALYAALAGFLVYVFVYTPLKPRTGYAVFVGAVAGATPPLVGYAAAAHTLDWYAAALFAFLFLWQLPHFLAIARFRFEEYFAAGVPLLVSKPKDDAGRRRARKIFYLSLVVLLLFCAVLILQRWMR